MDICKNSQTNETTFLIHLIMGIWTWGNTVDQKKKGSQDLPGSLPLGSLYISYSRPSMGRANSLHVLFWLGYLAVVLGLIGKNKKFRKFPVI